MAFKDIIKRCIAGMQFLRRPSVFYCSNRGLLPAVFVRTQTTELRRLFLLPDSPHETQLNQDIFALLINRFRAGFFLEIGANDGFTLSNTVYLEEQFGWGGLLVEANPQYSESLKLRKSMSVISAVVKTEGYYDFRTAGLYGGIVDLLDNTYAERTREAETVSVWGTTLERILKQSSAPSQISFVSIDVEGAEVPIIEQMCALDDYRFTCGCIEYNGRKADYIYMKRLLESANYQIIWEHQTGHDLFFIDSKKYCS